MAALVLLAGLLGGCAQEAPGGTESPSTGDDSDWEVVESQEGGTIQLENERLTFLFHTDTTHFEVTDRRTGRVYTSIPAGTSQTVSDETLARSQSEVSLVYYDANSNRLSMSSTADSVNNQNMVIKRQGDVLRVYYTLGSENMLLLVPQVFTQETFEVDICESEALSRSQVRRIKRYYDLYTPEDPTEEYEAMAELYPVLREQPLYILKDTVDDLNRIEIDEYMQAVGYTEEDYAQALNALQIEEGETDEAGFVIPVEYALTTDGFTARVLMDKVTEQSDSYTLQQIDLLEYFGAADAGQSGSFLVPDGAGALIRMNGVSGSYSQRIYGSDPAVKETRRTLFDQRAALPVYGVSYGETGMLAIVEGAAASATIHVNTISDASPFNNAYLSFAAREMDVTDIGTDRNIPVFNLYSRHLLQEIPQVRYVLLDNGQADVAGMAAYYRQYLLQAGALPQTDGETGLFLDYLGLATDDASFLGIPYSRRLTLSTLADIQEDVAALQEAGLTQVALRLQGYGGAGITHGLSQEAALHGSVGSWEELTSLAGMLSGGLYLEADFLSVYQDGWFDGFSAKADTAQSLNRSLIVYKSYDPVTREYEANRFGRYLLKPEKYAQTAASFLESLDALVPGGQVGVSYSSAGSLLTGDYHPSRDWDRNRTESSLREVLESAADRRAVLTDGGNLYALAGLSRLANVPLTSSHYDILDEEVPFYPMVVHGSLPYTGASLNLAADPDTAFLRAVEYGAGLAYTLITQDDLILSGTDYMTAYYSLSSDRQMETILEQAALAAPVWEATAGAAFTEHREVAEDVFLSRYDNGTVVYVNYRDEAVTADGVTVPARGFCLRSAS